MLIKGVDMVLVFVTDVDRSVEWYRQVLELPLKSRHGDFAMLDAGGMALALHGGADPADVNRGQGTIAVLRVADYDAAKQLLESRGCEFVFENSTPQAVFGTILDPDGNPVQILARK